MNLDYLKSHMFTAVAEESVCWGRLRRLRSSMIQTKLNTAATCHEHQEKLDRLDLEGICVFYLCEQRAQKDPLSEEWRVKTAVNAWRKWEQSKRCTLEFTCEHVNKNKTLLNLGHSIWTCLYMTMHRFMCVVHGPTFSVTTDSQTGKGKKDKKVIQYTDRHYGNK